MDGRHLALAGWRGPFLPCIVVLYSGFVNIESYTPSFHLAVVILGELERHSSSDSDLHCFRFPQRQ